MWWRYFTFSFSFRFDYLNYIVVGISQVEGCLCEPGYMLNHMNLEVNV